MKTMGILFASCLFACGASSKPAATAAPAPAEVAEVAEVPEVGEVPTSSDAEATAPPVFAMPAEPAPPPPPPPITAVAELLAVTGGASVGTMTFEVDGLEVKMSGSFTGLPPGLHAFYIHQRGDCARKGVSAGPHLDPTRAKHGPPASANRHAGDLGDLTVGADGTATFAMTTDSVVLAADRPDSVLNRTVVVHARKDDKRGDGGAAIACGVVLLR